MLKYSYNDIMEPWCPEEFKIIDLENVKKDSYAISNYGRVKNIKTNNILTQINDHGYRKISLNSNIIGHNNVIYLVHILVAMYFIPKTEDDILNCRNIVNHKNFITSQNYVHNLEWVNYQENMAHFQEYGHLKLNSTVVKRLTQGWGQNHKGEEIHTAKLTEEQVHAICKLLESGCYDYKFITSQIGLEYNKNNRMIIYNIARGTKWKHISNQYDIKGPKNTFNYLPYVKPVCELLDQGFKPKEIIEKLGLEYNRNTQALIQRIKSGVAFSEIAKDYNFFKNHNNMI